MKHFLVLQQLKFYITSGASQDDNVNITLESLCTKEVKKVHSEANKSKIAVYRNPVLKLLLSRILLKCSRILTST